LRFLAAAGTLLAASLDDATTLDRVAQLAVPDLADNCVVHLLETDGRSTSAGAGVIRPRPRWCARPIATHSTHHATPRATSTIHTAGRAVPRTSDALLLASAAMRTLETLRWLGLILYLRAVLQGRTFGAITLALGESRRRYGPDDLALAEELARRTAIALDNVQLYQRAQTEIAERQRVEATLRESQERLAGIVGSAMDAIISIAAAQRIVVFNVAAEQMFGCPATAALGQPIDRFIPPALRSSHATHIRAFGQTGATSRSCLPGI
jgi:PAS domain-containing protein